MKQEERTGGILAGWLSKKRHGEPECALVQESETPEQAQQACEQPEGVKLEFAAESAVNRLWELWCRQNDTAVPEPDLHLERAGDLPLTATRPELEREARRMSAAVCERVEKRVKQLPSEGESLSAPDLDADYMVHVSDSRMAAWVLILPPSGAGRGADPAELAEQLSDRGVTAGLDAQESANFLRQPYFRLWTAARGTRPAAGADGYVIERVPRQLEWSKAMDEGIVDYRAQSNIIGITAGEVICDIVPPTEGTPGLRVDGSEIPAKKGGEAKVPMGTNTEITKDRDFLVASLDGHVLYGSGVFQVKPSLVVSGDVDYSSGNIAFRGDVHIAGDVRVNFQVRATGNVVIDGLVEAATVEADGDVVITKGVLGEGRALIRSGKSVKAKFLESCTVYSAECTYSDCIISSQIFSDKRISVMSGRGAVIGGSLTAGELVEAVSIGTESERRTEIVLGLLPNVQKELKDIEKALGELHAEQKTMGKAAESDAKARLRKSVLAMKEDRLLKRRQELDEKKPQIGKCCLSGGTVYPGTELTISHIKYCFSAEHRRCKARFDEDEQEIVVD